MDHFDRLIILKILKPERIQSMVAKYVSDSLGIFIWSFGLEYQLNFLERLILY